MHKVEAEIGGRTLSLESGRLAKQAHGSEVVQYGDTVVLAAACTADPRPGLDFFPLQVDYREKTQAAGKFPGGFFKREGRPTQKEILTMRMIDRPMRPLFPQAFVDEVQIHTSVLAADLENDPDILAMVAASAAVAISKLPWEGPTGSVRVGRVEGEFIINPTHSQMEFSDLDLVLAGHADGVNMIEIGARELADDVVADAIAFGYESIKKVVDLINELVAKCGQPSVWKAPEPNTELIDRVNQLAASEMREAKGTVAKQERGEKMDALKKRVFDELSPADAEKPPFEKNAVKAVLHDLEEEVVRELMLTGKRSDGRGTGETEIRPLECEVSVLPRVHGSAVFSRGETQALVVTTLGTVRDEQIIDGLVEEYSKKFMLHYNFPPYSVGEVRRIMGPGRREIGHGSLAERSLEAVLPSPDVFPYTIRLVSDILESNGSSSMASVCGGTLALMDAGVPIAQPVAGISIGMVCDGDKRVLITDILGEEDHFGDMDFKVAGTQRGITGVQLDLKTRALNQEIIVEVLARAKAARIEILKQMLKAIPRPRAAISEFAPRILTIRIPVDKIGKLIGPGGKGIKKIEADTGAKVEIEDDGTVYVSCLSAESAEQARAMVEAVTAEVKVGSTYTGRVTTIKDFGAFIEVTPGQDGLCHISELSDGYIKSVEEVCKIGDTLRVKVINIDDHGRVKLSRKAVLQDEGGDGKDDDGEKEPVASGGEQRDSR